MNAETARNQRGFRVSISATNTADAIESGEIKREPNRSDSQPTAGSLPNTPSERGSV